MLAVLLHALEHLAHPIRRLPVDVIQNQFGVAEDGVQRGPQLVAHIGEELRLMLACLGELPALVADFSEERGENQRP